MRELAGTPGVSHLDAVARVAKLDDAKKSALARRALLQRATRIFALPDATFEVYEPASLVPEPGVAPIGVRTLIHHGLTSHYSEERVREELALVANARFHLAGTDEVARARLAEYGLGRGGVECVRHLARTPSTLDQLCSALSKFSAKEIMTCVYALLSADDLVINPMEAGVRASRPRRPKTASIPGWKSATSTTAPAGPAAPAAASVAPAAAPAAAPVAAPAAASMPRAVTNPGPAGSRSVKLSVGKRGGAELPPELVNEIRVLFEATRQRADSGCDHYQLLGVARDAAPSAIRSAYFALAKKLHPDRVRGVGLSEYALPAQHLFASINGAFNAIGTPEKRALYDATLASGGTGDKTRDQAEVEKQVVRLLSAEEHFLHGERALRLQQFDKALEEFREAVQKNSDEAMHHASLGWALWCAAKDKKAVRNEVDAALRHAIELSPACVPAYFYRGQIAAACGQEESALGFFHKVVALEPSHREAELQVRLLQSRKHRKDTSSGLFDRFKRK
jgi:tetratricopeptide (TPR) repeat protein